MTGLRLETAQALHFAESSKRQYVKTEGDGVFLFRQARDRQDVWAQIQISSSSELSGTFGKVYSVQACYVSNGGSFEICPNYRPGSEVVKLIPFNVDTKHPWDTFKTRVRLEATRMAQQLGKPPEACPVFSCDFPKITGFFVENLGVDLVDWLNGKRRREYPLLFSTLDPFDINPRLKVAIGMIREVIKSEQTFHVRHNDLKLENFMLMLDEHGEPKVTLVDFGASVQEDGKNPVGFGYGSLFAWAPEICRFVFQGQRPSADDFEIRFAGSSKLSQFSLGIALIELLLRTTDFRSREATIRKGITPRIDSFTHPVSRMGGDKCYLPTNKEQEVVGFLRRMLADDSWLRPELREVLTLFQEQFPEFFPLPPAQSAAAASSSPFWSASSSMAFQLSAPSVPALASASAEAASSSSPQPPLMGARGLYQLFFWKIRDYQHSSGYLKSLDAKLAKTPSEIDGVAASDAIREIVAKGAPGESESGEIKKLHQLLQAYLQDGAPLPASLEALSKHIYSVFCDNAPQMGSP